MGSDCGPDRTDRKLLRVILPEHLAVLDVFLEKGIVDSCITKPEGQGKIDAAGILNLFYQEIVSVFGAPGFSEDCHHAVFHGDNGLDGKHAADHGHRFGNPAAFFQIFQCA